MRFQLLGNTAIAPGKTFNGPVPLPDNAVQQFLDGLGFQHPLEQWGAANLTCHRGKGYERFDEFLFPDPSGESSTLQP